MPQRIRLRPSGVDQFEVANQHTFFRQVLREGRHGTSANATDLGVVSAAGSEEKHLVSFVMNRRDDRNVRQVRATTVGVIGNEHITRLHVGVVSDDRPYRQTHGAKVNRNVRRVHH